MVFYVRGDRIIVRFGDRRHGSPGIRVQTFCEYTFEFRVLVDAIATYNLRGIAGAARDCHCARVRRLRWKALLPTARATGDKFRLCLKGEDRWGNPSNQCSKSFTIRSNIPRGRPAGLGLFHSR